MTNFEKIKAMTVTQIAKLLAGKESACEMCVKPIYCGTGGECHINIKKWLESEDEDDVE